MYISEGTHHVTHHSHSQALTQMIHVQTDNDTSTPKLDGALPGELTTLDWWYRQSSICFAILLSTLFSISLSYCHCFSGVYLDQSLISLLFFSASSPPICSVYLPPLPPCTLLSFDILQRQSPFHMNPLSTMGTKQMYVSNTDGMILLQWRDKWRVDSD